MNGNQPKPTRAVSAIGLAILLVLGLAAVVGGVQAWRFYDELQETRTALAMQQAQAQAPKPSPEVARLQKLLDEKDAAYIILQEDYRKLTGTNETSAGVEQVASAADGPRPPGRGGPDGQSRRGFGGRGSDWLERLKTEDPERYKQMVEEREQRRKQSEKWFQDQVATLEQRAQASSSPDEAAVASQLTDTLAKLKELGQQWQAVRELPDEERRAAMEQLGAETRETYQKLSQLSDKDRQIQLANLARSVGYTDATAVQSFVDSVGNIYSKTSYTSSMREAVFGDRGGGGFPGGGPPPGGGGPPGGGSRP